MAQARVYGPVNTVISGDVVTDEYHVEIFGTDMPPVFLGHDSFNSFITVTAGTTIADQEAAILADIQLQLLEPVREGIVVANENVQFVKYGRGV